MTNKEYNKDLNKNTIYGFDWYSYGGFRESKISGTVSTGFDRLRGGTTIVVIKREKIRK